MVEKHIADRFWSRVVQTESGCWKWKTKAFRNGYPYVNIGRGKRRLVPAHRVSYMIHKGQIPDGKLVLHSCDNRECSNPEHLSVGTHQDNMDQMWARGRGVPHRIYGERNVASKLTDENVKLMRKMREAGILYSQIGKVFSITESAARMAIIGETWPHL